MQICNTVVSDLEDDYTGPQLKEGRVTQDFMKELMQLYKDQKQLHRKYAYQVMYLLKIFLHAKIKYDTFTSLLNEHFFCVLCTGNL